MCYQPDQTISSRADDNHLTPQTTNEEYNKMTIINVVVSDSAAADIAIVFVAIVVYCSTSCCYR